MIQLEEITGLLAELEENYQHLHSHPELGFEEYETSKFILKKLAEYGIEGKQIAQTGVIATINGAKPGKTVAIRADIDALPLTETAPVSCRSQNDGVMHACGHDSHITMLLGAAKYFAAHTEEMTGSVRLIFQPAEEGMRPERMQEIVQAGLSDRGGAASMIQEGALEGVDACFALHIFPNIPTGVIAVPHERAMASSDVFRLDICGQGGHGSSPETAIDPTGALAAVIAAFNALPSRELSAIDSCSLSIGVVQAGSVWNAIPDKAHIEGGVRTYDNGLREQVFDRLPKLAQGICEAHRCRCEFTRMRGYDPTVNAPVISKRMLKVAGELFGEERALLIERPAMGSEDVGYYFQKVPGAIGMLGCKSADMPDVAPHNPNFRIDQNALRYGVLFHINMALDYLSEE